MNAREKAGANEQCQGARMYKEHSANSVKIAHQTTKLFKFLNGILNMNVLQLKACQVDFGLLRLRARGVEQWHHSKHAKFVSPQDES